MTGNSSNAGRRDSGGAGWLLGLIFVCLAIGIVAAGYLYYRNYEKRYRSEVERQLSAVADLKVGELVQWRKERLADGAVFFKNGSFSGFVRRFFEMPEDAQAQQQIQAWVEKCQTLNQYDHVRLLDAQGVTRMSVPAGRSEMSATVAQRLPEVLRTGQVTFQDFYRNEHDQRVYLAVLVPILDESDASPPLGVLVLRIDPETYVYPFIQRWPTSSQTAETLIVRREGNEVVYLNELRFQKNTPLTLRRPLDQEALPAARAALGQEGAMEGLDYRGVPVVAALRTIPGSPWSLVARMAAAEVYAPLRERLWQMLVLIGAVLFGAGASIALVWRQQRVRFYRTKYESEEARAKLAAIVEYSNDAIIGKSLDGTITSWNASAERLFGYRAAEMIGQSVTRIIPPNAHAQEAETLKQLGRGERVEHYETVRLAKDGRLVAVSLTISPVRDAAGTIIGAAKIARDITARKRAEEALRESAARYLALFRESTDGILIADIGTKTFKYANPALCRMLGYAEDELRTMGVPDIHPKEALQRVVAEFEALIRGNKTLATDIPCLRKDGSVVYVDINQIKITVDGMPCSVGFFRDITERKRAEEALRNSELMLNEMGRIAEVGGWEMDLITRRARWTKGTYDIVEIGYGDPVPGPDEHVSYYLPEYRPIVEGAMKKLIEEDVPLDFEAKLRTAKGNIKWCRALGKAVRKDDVCMKVYGTFQNITERKQAEEALQESEGRFVQFMRYLPAMTFIKDCERRIVFVNERVGQVFGLAAADCLGKVSEDLWPGPIGRKIREDDERVLGNGEVMTVVQEIPTQDGPRVFRAIKFPIPRGQQPPLLGDISLDVTEIRQAEEKVRQLNVELEQRVRDRTAELEAANQELEAFSYSVSHDLRAPLRAMDGFSMALLEDCAGKLDKTAQDHLRRIRAGSQRMAALIDDLLNLSREARAEMRRESVDLTAMAEEIGAEFQRAHPDRQVKSVVAPALAADADARMLRMVLNNLLDNAWKFTSKHEQARIEVGAREQDGQRVFFVRDNGAGFDMAYAGRLFGAFQRLHSTQEFAGTGIGLAIVQRIIQRHGGRVWAEGAVGQGATVYFTLGKERD
jgi:PAS domain S-box-containing protein